VAFVNDKPDSIGTDIDDSHPSDPGEISRLVGSLNIRQLPGLRHRSLSPPHSHPAEGY
jgi:hypothetical protein